MPGSQQGRKTRAKQLEEGVFTIGFKGVRQTLEGTKRYDVYLARVYIFFFIVNIKNEK